jgi:protein MpaA
MTDVPLPERGTVRHPAAPFGASRAGAPLHVFGPLAPGTPLVLAATHGNETETTVALSAALRTVAPGELRCAVVLALNPDGTLLATRGNGAGVDLNRNFPATDWAPGTVLSHWSSQTAQVVELSRGKGPASEPETQALVALVDRLAPPWILSLHAPIGAVLEPEPSALGDALMARTGLRRLERVNYATSGVLDTWARERGIACVTLELPRITHDEAVVHYAPILADLLRGAL